ncbi:MFS transporter [Alicyclobacillus ferrooxydans]|uniref:Major facilitator superfamily (MFS) profile domain-containing protein n=1 Tax=Alicyclobacillus ferrooxydans TaxID=471514 RepID=A0A0P9D8I4_9BACL|nr:MFS transporter [Alicyclobacillus ferrooxydans]KPV45634.1 hypothetical protein AN477_01590 [Alicyclobacillus ferrooxydans]
MLKALRKPQFRLLWGGQAISALGDSSYQLALNWLIATQFGTAQTMAIVQMASALPTAITRPLSGTLIDRWTPKFMLTFSNTAMTILMAIFAVVSLHSQHFLVIITLIALFGVFSSNIEPAFFTSIPETMNNKDLESANSAIVFLYSLTGMIGPVLGAALITLMGNSSSFWFDSGTFLLAALTTIVIKYKHRSQEHPKVEKNLRMKDSWLWILKNPWAVRVHVTEAMANLLLGLFWAGFPIALRTGANAHILSFGGGYTLIYAGATLTSLFSGKYLKRINDKGLIAYLSISGLAIAISLSVAGKTAWMLYPSAFAIGILLPWFNLISHQSLQESAPREMLGRITSVGSLLTTVMRFLGYFLVAVFNQDVLFTFATSGIIVLLMIGFVVFRRRSLMNDVAASL